MLLILRYLYTINIILAILDLLFFYNLRYMFNSMFMFVIHYNICY